MSKIKKFFKKHKLICFIIIFVLSLSIFNESYAMYNNYRVSQAYAEFGIDSDNLIYLADIDGTDGEYVIFKDKENKYKVLEMGRINIFVGGLNTGENDFIDITETIESDKLYFHKAEALGRKQWYALGKGEYEVYNLPDAENELINQVSHFKRDDGVTYTKFMIEGIEPEEVEYAKIK